MTPCVELARAYALDLPLPALTHTQESTWFLGLHLHMCVQLPILMDHADIAFDFLRIAYSAFPLYVHNPVCVSITIHSWKGYSVVRAMTKVLCSD